MPRGEDMAPYIDDWRKEVRRMARTNIMGREPQGGLGKYQGRQNTKSNRDDSNSGGGDGDFGGGGGGAGGGRGSGGGHDNGGSGASGRDHNGGGPGGGGGGHYSGNSHNNNDNYDEDDNNSGNGKNANTGNNNGDGGKDNDTASQGGGDYRETSPPVALSPEDYPASSQSSPYSTTVDPPSATAMSSSTAPPSPTGSSGVMPDSSTVAAVSAVTPAPLAATSASPIVISLTTTIAPPDTDVSAPEEGLYDPAPYGDNATSSDPLMGTALADTNPTPSAFAVSAGIGDDSGSNNSNHGGGRNGDRDRANGNSGSHNKDSKSNQDSLSPTTERVLISVASIGGFVLVCFLIWIVWQIVKRAKARKNGVVSSGDSRRRRRRLMTFPERVLAKVPFLRSRLRQWQELDEASVTGLAPPGYKSGMARMEPVEEFYAREKTYQLPSKEQPMDQSSNARQSALYLAQNLPSLALTNSPPSLSADTTQQWLQEPQQSLSSTDAAHLGNTLATTDETETFRSRMPDAYFNQSELARGPSNAHDPARRQVNRVSELSSISSGFGDGDLILPDSNVVKAPQPVASSLRQSTTNLAGRFSWVSQAMRSSRRDTVYTQSSEDSPPRFRTISSWVNQQTGRVKRAQQRQEDGRGAPPVPVLSSRQIGVPGIHNPPAEQTFNLMMGDDEVPRPVEDMTRSTAQQPQRS